MRIKTQHFFIALVFLFSISTKKNCNEAQLKDFSIFKKVLLSKEGTIDLHISSDSIDAHLEKLKRKLQTELSIIDQFKLYSFTLSKIQCGHTQIHANKEVLKEWLAARNSLPIDFKLIGKHLVVNKLSPLDYDIINEGKSLYEMKKWIKAGSEIISIDNKTVPQMMEGMGRFLSSDENSIDFKYYQVNHVFDFYRHMSSPFTKDSIRVEYVFKGDTNEIYFAPGTAPVRTMNDRLKYSSLLSDTQEASVGEFSIIKNCGYFRFKSFKASHGGKYELFLENSFRKMKSKNIKRLIVDLRGNTGGAMQYSFMRYLVGEDVNLGKYMVEKPKNGIENSHFKKFHSEFGKHRRMSNLQKKLIRQGRFNDGIVKTESINSNLIFDGEIIVITNEGTFSSASILACHLKTLKNAKIVGSSAGGSFYSGNAGTLVLTLPNTKLQVLINPNTFYSQIEPSGDPSKIKIPDLIIDSLILDPVERDAYYFKQANSLFE